MMTLLTAICLLPSASAVGVKCVNLVPLYVYVVYFDLCLNGVRE